MMEIFSEVFLFSENDLTVTTAGQSCQEAKQGYRRPVILVEKWLHDSLCIHGMRCTLIQDVISHRGSG